TPAEETIAAVWREILGLDAVGIHDPFFDLGGHSLALARVHAKLRDRLAVALPITALFQHPTVAALAAAIDSDGTTHTLTLPHKGREDMKATAADGIAVIGMAGRFPGAADVDAFWR